MGTKEEVLESLKPLMREAKITGEWFYSNYQDMWFSPKELENMWEEGRFIWGPANWKLRDPQELIMAKCTQFNALDKGIATLKDRIKNG
jgi:hypothetical protein